ncbi:hypothetical protein B0T16DRAFT_444958 [Cercophora newfieldiana]|uniref:Fungal N-terminal domain-containing protein n=1 Tax=Cercophora newfieldiana TaxID=92897 RepID=A0AA39YAJ5_9PEZI|nr:hypothetical protein B0T16DRAFT_444958 [Cercophora newfieldiana]
MVSGLEVAGVILGSLSLIIQLLEHRGKGGTALPILYKYHKDLFGLAHSLKAELTKFEDICRRLLGGLMPQSQIEVLMNDPTTTSWLDGDIQRKIQARLCRSFPVFEASMMTIKAAIDTVKTHVEVQSSTMSRMRRSLVVLRQQSYTEAMATIIKSISDLDTLSRGLKNVELSSFHHPPICHGERKRLSLIRGKSNSFTKALQATLRRFDGNGVGFSLEGALITGVTPTEESNTTTRALVFQVGVSFKKRAKTDGDMVDEVKTKKSQTWQVLRWGQRCETPGSILLLPTPASESAMRVKTEN